MAGLALMKPLILKLYLLDNGNRVTLDDTIVSKNISIILYLPFK